MKTKNLYVGVSFGLAQLALLSSNAWAQEKPVSILDEVVVTATKTDQKQSQTGKVITLITREQLEKSAGKSVAQLLSEQAGIIVNGAGSNPGKDKSLFFRGAPSAYTVVLIDGILASNPGFGSSLDLRNIAIDQVDHIEILKGGQSTLYGSDAVAGVINIVTKKGGQKGNNVSGVLSAGSYHTVKGSLGLNSLVENVSYNIVYTHDRTDGISEASQPAGNPATFDKDGFKRDALNLNLGIQLDERLKVNPFVRYTHGKFDYDEDSFVDGNNLLTSDYVSTGLNANYQLDKGKISFLYSYEANNSEFESTYYGLIKGRSNVIDLYANHNLGKYLKLLAGIDNRSLNIIGVPKESNLFSAYSSLFLNNAGDFNLEVGGRYNSHNEYGDNFTYSATPSYTIAKTVKVFATASSAFRAPTLNALYGKYGANLSLKPEKSKSYEGGASINLLDNKLGLRVVGYIRNLTDAIIYGSNGYINQDKQKDKGFEIEPSFKSGKFNLTAFYAFVEGETTKSENSTVDYLLRRPKNSLGANIGVEASSNLYLSANFHSYSKRVDFDFSTYPANTVNLGAYNLVNAYAQYTLAKKHIKLFVDLKNILDEKYSEVYGYNTIGFNVNGGISFNIR